MLQVIRPVLLVAILVEMSYFLYRISTHGDLDIGSAGQMILWVGSAFLLGAWWSVGASYFAIFRAWREIQRER